MNAVLKLKNTLHNQHKARMLRDINRHMNHPLEVSFSHDLEDIILKGEFIHIPEKDWLTDDIIIEGQAKAKGKRYEIYPKDKGKTVNLHLDSELVSELEEIKRHVHSKTQHDLLLTLFKKGLDQYKTEEK